MTNGKYKIQNNVTTSSAGKGVLDAYQGKVLNDKFNNYVPLSQKGVANGVATLDGDAKVPTAQLPSYVDDVIEAYIREGATALSSTWLSLTDGGAALTPEKGKIYLIMTAGSYQNKQYRWGGSTYVLCNPSDVNSVNGFTGVVVLKELTIQKNGTQVGDKFNGSANKTINITVPTKTSDITNNSGFITAADDITGNAATATNATNDANGDKIDTTYLKKTGGTMDGATYFNNTGGSSITTPNKPLVLRRNTSDNESAKHYFTDGAYNIKTTNDERTTDINFIIENTDMEQGGGANPNTNTVTIRGNASGSEIIADSFTGKLTNARKIDGVDFDGSSDIIHYGTCSTAAATETKEIACPGFNLVTGAIIIVRFTVTNSAAVANIKFNVNGTGAKNVKYRNGNLPAAGDLANNRTYMFVYDGTYYQ
jgi:hypothetical protein